MSGADALLRAEQLSVAIGEREILRDVSLTVDAGRMAGLIGETGSGKSMLARTLVDLLPPRGRITAGSVELEGRRIAGAGVRTPSDVRGRRIGSAFQDARTALYPFRRVEDQLATVLRTHRPQPRRAARAEARRFLTLVGIDDPARVARQYPHELSGGMAQRVMIAGALIAEPALLIADEPTTGLDLRIQRQILDLLRSLQQRLELGVLMITHDLGIVSEYCDTVAVMHEGRVVESGPTEQVVGEPSAAYTRQLIAASRLDGVEATLEATA